MFSLTDDTLKQLQTVYKVDSEFEVQFAASFFVIELDQYLVTYLDVIKAKETKRGLGSQFISDLVEFLRQQMQKNPEVKGAHFLVGQSQLLKPHAFFAKQGFGPLPKQFEGLKLDECDLVYMKVRKFLEEEKLDDGKSDIFAVTTKITRGKALDKHCTICDKKISGTNWNKHVKKVHDGAKPFFNKCNE